MNRRATGISSSNKEPISKNEDVVGDHFNYNVHEAPPLRGDYLSSSSKTYPTSKFKLYWRRWLMLLYISLLNFLSDWTCYSVAPIAVLTNEAYGTIYPTVLVVIFFCSNAIATASEPYILSRLGLRRTIVLGSALLTMGNGLKSGIPGITLNIEAGDGFEWTIYGGFFLVGLSQPLYQCTPALLSASWFPEKERTLATGIALNSNQLGIGFAFVVGTVMVQDKDDIPKYFQFLTILSFIVFAGTISQFEDAPPTPPSDTAKVMKGSINIGKFVANHCAGKRALDDVASISSASNVLDSSTASAVTVTLSDSMTSDYDTIENTPYSVALEPIPILTSPNNLQIQIRDDQIFLSAKACLSRPGFVHALVAFALSGIEINTLSTYMDYLIDGPKRNVGIIGGCFQFVIMISSLGVGKFTDSTRAYYAVTTLLLVWGGFALAKCALSLLYGDGGYFSINWYWLPVAALIGPLQPVATELGVDVAYPLSENTVLVILQLFSNLLSALFIPLFGFFRAYGNNDDDFGNRPEFLVPLYIMILMHACVTVFFATFNGKYLRLAHERGKKEETLEHSVPTETQYLLPGKPPDRKSVV